MLIFLHFTIHIILCPNTYNNYHKQWNNDPIECSFFLILISWWFFQRAFEERKCLNAIRGISIEIFEL